MLCFGGKRSQFLFKFSSLTKKSEILKDINELPVILWRKNSHIYSYLFCFKAHGTTWRGRHKPPGTV